MDSEAGWTSWAEFAAADPQLAAFGASRLRGEVAYLGTVRSDALPRVHPVSPIISDQRLMLFMFPSSPKAKDLRADGRYALHSGVPDSEGTGGEFLVRGRARAVDDPAVRREAAEAGYEPRPEYILFELGIRAVLANTYADGRPQPQFWRNRG